MDCSAAAIGLLLLVIAVAALAAVLAFRASAALGLGASLLLLGFLYQRYIFRPAGGEETGA